MIKILHLITDLDVGGAEMMLCKLVERMDRSSFKNSVVSLKKTGPLESRIKEAGASVESLDMTHGVLSLLGGLRLMKIIRKEKPDILQTWLYHSDLLGLVIGRFMRIPHILWNLRCSNMDMSRYAWSSRMILPILSKLSSCPEMVLVNSSAGRLFHEALGYHPKKWKEISNGFDLDVFHPDKKQRVAFRQEIGLSDSVRLIGSVGRFDAMKDYHTLFKAASLLRKDFPDVHCLLAGLGLDQENDELRKILNDAKLEKNVHLLGPRDDVNRIMSSLDVFISSSSFGEGFSNVIGEAMACGVVPVATDVGDSARIVGHAGKIVPPGDPAALSEACREVLLLGSDEREKMGVQAREKIEKTFSIQEIAKQYERLYHEVAANREKN